VPPKELLTAEVAEDAEKNEVNARENLYAARADFGLVGTLFSCVR
jgi:hypothetical protein